MNGSPMRFVAAICLAIVAMTTAALADGRVALVVGNSRYQFVPAISNAQNDSRAFADLLRAEGFDVEDHQNLNNETLRRVVRTFVSKTRDADVAVIYFAGHGIEVDGMNYLVPVDARLKADLDVQDEAVPLDRVLQVLEPASRLRLVILDACRDNPFLPTMKRTVATRAVSRGLAQVEPSRPNTLIAFAAKAGSTADDGDGEHGPFTEALLKHIAEPGLDIRLALGRVRDAVLEKTKNAQEPFVYGSLGGSVVTLSARASKPVEQQGDSAADEARKDFAVAQKLGTSDGWDAFLSRHKDGYVADMARRERDRLAARTDPPKAIEQAATPQPAAPRFGASFTAADRERVAQLAARNQIPRPAYEIRPPDSDVAPAFRRFVGVWASRIGYNGGLGRQAMMIGTSVTKEGQLRGFLLTGPPTAASVNRQPAGISPFAARIEGSSFSFQGYTLHKVDMSKDGWLHMKDSAGERMFVIDLEPVWLAADPAAPVDVAALNPADGLPNAPRAGHLFDDAARARVSAIAARNKLPLPGYAFDQSGRKTSPDLRKFIGVWASVVGFNGGPVHAIMIVTDVDEAGEADGHYVVGASPPGSPAGARPARSAPLHGPIVGQRLSFTMPRSTNDATLTAGNSFRVKGVQDGGRTLQVELVPVWTLVSGLASPAAAVAPAAPAKRNSATRAVPAAAKAAIEPARAPQSLDSPGGGGGPNAGGGGGGRRPLGMDVLNSPRFPMCARMASERGLQGPGSGRRTFIRNCVSSG